MSGSGETKIGPANTWISAGILVAIVAAVGGASRWATRIETRLESIEAKLQAEVVDRWTGTDMRFWALRLGDLNPDLEVPAAGGE